MLGNFKAKFNFKKITSCVCAIVLTCSALCSCASSQKDPNSDKNTSSTQKGSASFVASKTDITETDSDLTDVQTSSKPLSATTNSSTSSVTTTSKSNTLASTQSSSLWSNTSLSSQPVVKPEYVDNSQLLLNGLSQQQRILVERINLAISEFEDVVEFDEKTVTSQDIANALTIISFVNLDVTYVSTKYSVSVDDEDYVSELTLYYTKTKEQHEYEKAQLELVVEKIIEGCDATNDYDVVKYLHDSIVRGCEYDFDGENMLSAYGCLVDGKAICEGYSKAFVLLCSRYGIECVPVVGNCIREGSDPEPHMWNMVKIDEKWYHIDLTWDDPVIKTEDNSLGDYVCYEYFGLSDDKIQKDHEITEISGVEYPVAEDDFRDYFYEYGLAFDTMGEAVMNIQGIVNNAVVNDEHYVRIKINDDEEFSKLLNWLFETYANDKKMIFNILNNAQKQTGNENFVTKRYSKLISEDNNILTLILNYE